jgi:hypothetical protein
LFSSIVINTGTDADAFNPLHSGDGAQFSNAFAALLIPLAIGLALSAVLPSRKPANEASDDDINWTPHCQVPWCPELESQLATATQGAASND